MAVLGDPSCAWCNMQMSNPLRRSLLHIMAVLLQGLNPHQNRTIPPLKYEWVYGLKRDFPHLTFRYGLQPHLQAPHSTFQHVL